MIRILQPMFLVTFWACLVHSLALSNSRGVSITSGGVASSLRITDDTAISEQRLKTANAILGEGHQQSHMRTLGREITSDLWSKAEGQVLPIQSSVAGVNERIWANSNEPECEENCVAHCVAGQPRDFTETPGLRKALKYRMFKQFSDSYVVFAVFVTSAYHSSAGAENSGKELQDGEKGFARTEIDNFTDTQKLVSSMEDVGVHRALLIQEACQEPSCMENPALQCDAKDFGLRYQFDATDGKLHNVCDVQLRRFQTCMNLVNAYEQERSLKFTWVTRSRPDVYWVKPIQHFSTLRPVGHFREWAPSYGGLDWFYAVPRAYADVLARFPEEASCSQLHHPVIQGNCEALGCECWLASWMLLQGVPFRGFEERSNGFIPAKFCEEACPYDWDATNLTREASIATGLPASPRLLGRLFFAFGLAVLLGGVVILVRSALTKFEFPSSGAAAKL